MSILKFFPFFPGRDDPVARVRFSALLSMTLLLIVVITSFLVFNIRAGKTVFIIQNIFLLTLSFVTLILLKKGHVKTAVYTGFVIYGVELLLFILSVGIFMPEHLRIYNYNILLLLAITFILGSSIICVTRTQQFILITLTSVIAAADYIVSENSFFFPAIISVISVAIVTGVASVLFMKGSVIIDSLLKEKNRYLEEISDKSNVAAAALRTKSEFFAAVSHDIRTPLFSLTGFSELLHETPLTEIQRDYLSGIKISSEVLLKLVNGVLHLAELESGSVLRKGDTVSQDEIVLMLNTLFSKKALDSGVGFSVVTSSSAPDGFVTDYPLLSQLLINLVSNAFKFTEKGEVRVEISAAEFNNKNYISFMVIDTGIGVPPDELKTIFEPFVKIGRDIYSEGAGLGLAICRRGAELLNGIITVDSHPGKGSTFRLMIPHSPGIKALETSPVQPETTGKFAGTLLVAEDNDTNRFLMVQLLKSIGINADAALDGREAVEMYKKNKYSHLILDIEMPYKSGVEAALEIRAEAEAAGREVKIYAATADIYFSNKKYGEAMLFDVVIQKPFTKAELQNLILT